MAEYQLEIKQLVDYPRCRIYRQFIRTLMEDRSIRTKGGSGLFYYIILSSYANFRTSYRRIDGMNYTIYPGEWICRVSDLSKWFRTAFQYQALNILDELQKRHFITYSILGRGRLVKFRINGWRKHNTVLDYNAPCQKDTGFFFLSVSTAAELISIGRCSEIDCLLDLWINTIYNDEQVEGSEIGPVVYMRNGTGNPLVSYADLAARWGLSKATVSRILKRLASDNLLSLMTFPGNKGTVIYLKSYLSTMFQISDIIVDKEEVAMSLKIKLPSLPSDAEDENAIKSCVLNKSSSVSKSKMPFIIQKVSEILQTQGIPCFGCSQSQYKLYPLSNACEGIIQIEHPDIYEKFQLNVCCCNGRKNFRFELLLTLIENGGNKNEQRE